MSLRHHPNNKTTIVESVEEMEADARGGAGAAAMIVQKLAVRCRPLGAPGFTAIIIETNAHNTDPSAVEELNSEDSEVYIFFSQHCSHYIL